MRTRTRILNAFDTWRWAPAPQIDLIRTARGTAIYFEGIINGCHACFIEYQLTNLKSVKR